MRGAWARAILGAATLAAGCSPGTGLGTTTGDECGSCRHTTTGGGTGDARSTTGGEGTSTTTGAGATGGASSGGTSGGTSGAAPCQGALLTSTLVGAFAGSTIASSPPGVGAEVSALTPEGVPVAGEATLGAASGAFELCVTPGQTFETEVVSPGYVTTYVEDLDLTGNYSIGGIPLASTSTITAFATFAQGFNTAEAVIIIPLLSASGQPPCNNLVGWAVSATLPDGGVVAYKTAYSNLSGIPVESRTATDATGIAYIFNLDPSVTTAVLVTATQVDGGASCPINDGGPFTGRVAIAGSSFSFAPLILP